MNAENDIWDFDAPLSGPGVRPSADVDTMKQSSSDACQKLRFVISTILLFNKLLGFCFLFLGFAGSGPHLYHAWTA